MEKYQSTQELCVTILANGISVEHFLEKLEETQESCRKVGNSLKRAGLCGSLHALIQRVKERDEKEMVNALFFMYQGNESGCTEMLEERVLTKSEKDVLKEYGFPLFQYRNAERFPLEEWKDIFTNFDFLQVIHMNLQNARHLKMNRFKSKEIVVSKISNETQLIEMIERIVKDNVKKGDKLYLYGISNYITTKVKGMSNMVYKEVHLTKEEVWEWKQMEEMKIHLALLEERIKEIEDEKKIDLFVFGRIKMEIKEHIERYV
jgi:hypothetical protein